MILALENIVRSGNVSPHPGCAKIRSGTKPCPDSDDSAYKTSSARRDSTSKRRAKGWTTDVSALVVEYLISRMFGAAVAVDEPIATTLFPGCSASACAMWRY